MANFSELVGKVLTHVTVNRSGDDEIEFVCDDGTKFLMRHDQSCCESVSIEDINGDLQGLLNSPILVAEEASNDGASDNYTSSTWTFYKLANINGHVDIRWYGTSNGYYSEGVSFYRVSDPDDRPWNYEE